ncbi:MAG: hypothetical protein IJC04_04670 [Oscillospiraceae bacterium]|nr:hypothetical protein [Oscillospiraceae bacterium]
MLKIVKGFSTAYEMDKPVTIDNTVYIPAEDEETGEIISAEEVRRREEQKLAEQKAAEEYRIKTEVEKRLRVALAEKSVQFEKERAEIIELAKKEAAAITADTKSATMAVMEKAQNECVVLKEQAKQEGYNEGFAQGKDESLEKYKRYIDAAGKLLSEINSRKEAYYISNEEELRTTVFEMVKKITRTELVSDPEIIEGIIADAAKNFRNSDYIKITLAEDEITEKFRTDEKLIKDIIPFIPEIEIEFDDEAEEGTIILDNDSEIVDAGVPTQLEFLKEILDNTRGKTEDDF